jgi:uncharacterized protein
MDVTPLIRPGQQIIQSYAGGQFKVSGQVYKGAVIVTPDKTISWNAPDKISDLSFKHFYLAGKPDVILLGTGSKMQFLPPDLKKALKEKGLSPEPMDSGAACRTYNVLMAEGRIVAAFLLPFA